MLYIGKAIKIIRSAKEITISDLAKSSGVSISFVSLLEKGERQPSFDVVRRIADSLNVPSEVLILLSCSNGENLKSDDERVLRITKSIQKLAEAEDALRKAIKKENDQNECVFSNS